MDKQHLKNSTIGCLRSVWKSRYTSRSEYYIETVTELSQKSSHEATVRLALAYIEDFGANIDYEKAMTIRV